jgi:hypothetical protein
MRRIAALAVGFALSVGLMAPAMAEPAEVNMGTDESGTGPNVFNPCTEEWVATFFTSVNRYMLVRTSAGPSHDLPHSTQELTDASSSDGWTVTDGRLKLTQHSDSDGLHQLQYRASVKVEDPGSDQWYTAVISVRAVDGLFWVAENTSSVCHG